MLTRFCTKLRGALRAKTEFYQSRHYYISTPIFYVNAQPHIGHLYTTVLGDAAHRLRLLAGSDQTIFNTGTDEHGLKIQQAAEASGLTCQSFCDDVSLKFKELFNKSNIGYTSFIRTTDENHKCAVQHLWNTLAKNGYIYRGTYEGWYCISDENFVSDGEVMDVKGEDGKNAKVVAASGQPVVWMQEENFMFKLSDLQPQLLSWLDNNPEVIVPRQKWKEVRTMVEEGLPDLSISRLRETLQWGIPVPGNDDQTIYVWLDALANYLTVGGYPKKTTAVDCHVIGKDIVKFHAVYWPAFLMAANLPLPKQLVVHSHWLCEGKKMSKSLGNVVDPHDILDRFGTDAVRYFLLKEGRIQNDCDYSNDRMVHHVNELANTLGNLLSRSTAKKLNKEGRVPCPDKSKLREPAKQLLLEINELYDVTKPLLEQFEFPKGIEEIMSVLRKTNKYFDDNEPWVLVKDPDRKHQLDEVLYVTLESLRVCGILLQPIMPCSMDTLLTRLAVPAESRGITCDNTSVQSSELPRKLNGDPVILFQKSK